MLRTLVLNSSYMPISVFPLYTVSAKDALVRILNSDDKTSNRCECIYYYNRKVLTPSRDDLYWPSVIVNHTHKNIYKNELRMRRNVMLLRDNYECFWCGEELDASSMTYDHLIPRSKGGKHSYENVVCSCKRCNNQKGDSLPVGKWRPKYQPKAMTYFDLIEKASKYPLKIPDKRWLDFLPNWSETNIIIERGNNDTIL